MKRATTTRMLALDVFRGVTIAGMLLVNLPGSWSAIYTPVAHSEWHGCTPADLIFPFFLFIVGITTHLSFLARRSRGDTDRTIVRQALRRGIIIVLLGLAFSAFPYYPLTRITAMRIPGVLQRIGVTYIFGALLTLRTTVKQQVAIIVAILFGYWFAMTLIPVPETHVLGALTLDTPPATLAAWVDRLLFNGHLWINSVTWDPEGPFSTIPAIATVMLGALAGQWLVPATDDQSHSFEARLNALFAVGALGIMAGLMWNWSFPINKSLWTSSYVVYTAGVACVTLATCSWIVDVQRIRWWTHPFVIFGTNPIVVFVGSEVMARTIYSLIKFDVHGRRMSLQSYLYETLFASWLPPKDASLLFAACIMLVWLGILTILYRRKIFLKV